MFSGAPAAEPMDVLVIGGGNAALSAALTARSHGASVLMLDRAARELRGGNTRHTRNIRHAHDGPDEYVVDRYSEEDFWDDLVRVSGPEIDEELARLTVAESRSCPAFMERFGCRWQPPLTGTLQLARTNRFFLGGGKALLNAYYATAETRGVGVMYEQCVVDVLIDGDQCRGVVVERDGNRSVLSAKSYVVASGGFEANLGWLEDYWGPAAQNFVVRGSPYNDGLVLRALLDKGVMPVGDPKGVHAIAVDARSPKFDGGIVTRLDSIPFGIVVNNRMERFADEGADLWPRRYASWGRLIAEQDGQFAFSIYDSKAVGRFIPGIFPPFGASSINELAAQLRVSGDRLRQQLHDFNAAVPDGRAPDYDALDGLATEGIRPPKSNWATRIDAPPFFGYPLRPGVTFTYLGVRVNRRAEVVLADGSTLRNVFAAGEVMAGNVLTRGYLAGIGLTIGTVFGRIAGASAASLAASPRGR
jgi:tricarballylate dehydrogenase